MIMAKDISQAFDDLKKYSEESPPVNVFKITERMREEHDRFVFEQIISWCEVTTKMVISKRMLIRALHCFREEHSEEYRALMKEVEE